MKIELDVPQELIESCLIAGFEGGSNYWLQMRNDVTPFKGFHSFALSKGPTYLDNIFTGEGLAVVNEHDLKRKVVLITKELVATGLASMAVNSPRHFTDLLSENADAETGDVLLQYIVLGGIFYG